MTAVKAFKIFLLQFTIFTLLSCKVSASFREGEQENQNDFIWKDISDWTYSFTYSDYFEQKEGYVQAELISTPANPAAIQNYGLSHVSEEDGFNRWFYGYGFEADLYLVQNLNRAIIQWTDRQRRHKNLPESKSAFHNSQISGQHQPARTFLPWIPAKIRGLLLSGKQGNRPLPPE